MTGSFKVLWAPQRDSVLADPGELVHVRFRDAGAQCCSRSSRSCFGMVILAVAVEVEVAIAFLLLFLVVVVVYGSLSTFRRGLCIFLYTSSGPLCTAPLQKGTLLFRELPIGPQVVRFGDYLIGILNLSHKKERLRGLWVPTCAPKP